MKTYRSRSRLVLDLLAAIDREGPIGVTRALLVVNLTHAKIQELLTRFEANGWIQARAGNERAQWQITNRGRQVLADLRRVDAVMQDYGLGL